MATSDNVLGSRERSPGLAMAGLIAAVAVATVALAASDSLFLVVVLCLGLGIVAILRFDWFVYGQIFFLPVYPILGLDIHPRDIPLVMRFVMLAGVWVLRRHKGQSTKEWILGNKTKKGVLVFTATATLSLLASGMGPNKDALLSLEELLSYVAVFFALAGWVETKEQLEKIVKILLWSTVGVAVFGFCQVLAQGYTEFYYRLYFFQENLEEWSGRIVSFLFHFNSLAGYLNLVLPFSLAAMVLGKVRNFRLLGLICHSTALAALYLTGSRGGLIAYGGMVLISLWFLKPRRAAIAKVLLAGVLAATIVAVLPRESEGGRYEQADDYTVVTRLALWGAAGSMYLEHPVLGVGYGNYRAFYADYLPGMPPNQLDAHNLYLQFLSETGTIGFVAFCFLVWSFARKAVRLARSGDPLYRLIGIGVGGALAATLMHGMVDYLFNVSPQFGDLFWLVMALGMVAFDQIKDKERERGESWQTNSAGVTKGET